MGSFYFINTLMKTFTQFIKETNVTPLTQNAIKKFGSKGSFKKIAKGGGIGQMASSGTAGPRNRPTK